MSVGTTRVCVSCFSQTTAWLKTTLGGPLASLVRWLAGGGKDKADKPDGKQRRKGRKGKRSGKGKGQAHGKAAVEMAEGGGAEAAPPAAGYPPPQLPLSPRLVAAPGATVLTISPAAKPPAPRPPSHRSRAGSPAAPPAPPPVPGAVGEALCVVAGAGSSPAVGSEVGALAPAPSGPAAGWARSGSLAVAPPPPQGGQHGEGHATRAVLCMCEFGTPRGQHGEGHATVRGGRLSRSAQAGGAAAAAAGEAIVSSEPETEVLSPGWLPGMPVAAGVSRGSSWVASSGSDASEARGNGPRGGAALLPAESPTGKGPSTHLDAVVKGP